MNIEDLNEGDLCWVLFKDETRRARVTMAVIVGGAAHGDFSYYFELRDNDGDVVEADLKQVMVRSKVTLKNMRQLIDAGADWMDIAACAAGWLEDSQSTEDALDSILYMLRGKLHKYLAEAWLGGAGGLEEA